MMRVGPFLRSRSTEATGGIVGFWVAQAPPDPPVAAQVRALDHALQVAYDRGASDSEVAPLWEARQALLAGNDDLRDGPSNPNDI